MDVRIVIAYPPLTSRSGIPLLGQNRQFQWAQTAWNAYPMVPASAATLLKVAGHAVLWLDGIAENLSFKAWQKRLLAFKPDLIFIETKTPVVNQHWQIINDLKLLFTAYRLPITFALAGDHVTALPEESFHKSSVDFVLTGGDYDFLLLNLVNKLTKSKNFTLVNTTGLEPGIYYRKKIILSSRKSSTKYYIRNTGKFRLDHNLNLLPPIDRDLTCWQLYSRANSNYSRYPGSYTMFARDCWWGRCTFCSWTTLYPGRCWRTVTPQKAFLEVKTLVEKYHIKEIMDDSGTFPCGQWLRTFCRLLIKSGLNKKLTFNCNLRFHSQLTSADYGLMKQAGFRLLLFGLESVNQKTLDRLNKNLKSEEIIQVLKMAKNAGLEPHIAVMVGYPWEGENDLKKTLAFVKKILNIGLVDSLQATLLVPYPGTPLFRQAQKNHWLKTTNWENYDMRQSVLKSAISDKQLRHYIRQFYSVWVYSFPFLKRKAFEALKSPVRFSYYLRFTFKFFSRLLDFS